MNAAANSHQADESVSFVNSDSTSTQPIAVLNTCGGGVTTTPASATAPPLNPSATTFLPTATEGSSAGVTDN